MKRSLLLEPVGLDVSSCLAWGEVLTLFPKGCPVPAHDTRFQDLLWDKLESISFDASEDALVIAGKLSKITVALLVLWQYNDDYITILVWSESEQQYKQVVREFA